jgi:hypothetical protein
VSRSIFVVTGPARVAALRVDPTLSENVDEDALIEWDHDTRDMTDEERAVLVSLLTLDSLEDTAPNPSKWAAIADADRARGGR